MMFKHRITVFTPTFNRAYIIEKLYISLCQQSFKDFEWLVVDDGSNDNTEEMFNKWVEDADFAIRYYKTQNGGKHRAINYGLDLAEGEIFFTIDSDDQLTADALGKMDRWFKDIASNSRLSGIVANKGLTATDTPNDFFKEPYLDKSLAAMQTYCENGKKVLGGERAIAFYTDFHRKYRFPEFSGENFMTEAVVYNRMSNDGYLMRFYNEIICLYKYQDDGLTNAGSSIFVKNPRGYGLWIKEKMKFNNICLKEKILVYYQFTCDLASTYDVRTIAECIGLPNIAIQGFCFAHKVRKKIKRK